MGCLKLTYDYQEQGEKTDTLNWRVWVNPESDFLGVVNQQNNGEESSVGFAGAGWSVGATAAIGTIGLNIQVGVVNDGKWPMAFFSLNHAVGVDISVEAGGFVVKNNNPNKPFRGSHFSGAGGSYNVGVGPVSYSYGGDGDANGGFPNNFTVQTVGVSASPTPVTLSAYHGNTWTWPSIPYIGLLLPRF